MKAVIIAGGEGTRVRSVTKDVIPKCLLKINNKTIIEYQIDSLKKYGIDEVIIVVGYLASEVRKYFGDGSKFGISIKYYEEKCALGTGGSLYYINSMIDDDFILLYGDTFLNINFDNMIKFHYKKKALVTLLSHYTKYYKDCNLILCNKKRQVLSFLEKGSNIENMLCNGGVYIFSKSIFNYVSEGKLDLEKDIISKVLCTKKVYSYYSNELVYDVGTVDRYMDVVNFFEKKVSVIIPFYKVKDEIGECIESVLKQDYNNIEVICVGRKDDLETVNIVKKYESVKCIMQDGIGLGNARNCGLNESLGDYILFLDGDDYIEKDAIRSLLFNMFMMDSDVVVSGFDRIDKVTNKIYSKEMINLKQDNLVINEDNFCNMLFVAPCSWGKLFKKEVIADITFLDEAFEIEDLIFFLNVLPNIKKISFINEVKWHYVVRKDSLISNVKIDKAYSLFDNLEDVRKLYNGKYLETFDVIAYLHLCISMFSRLLVSSRREALKYFKYVRSNLDKSFNYWCTPEVRYNGKITIKTFILSLSRILTKINCLVILLDIYNYIIKTFKIEIKW